jgi:hypothetical protein
MRRMIRKTQTLMMGTVSSALKAMTSRNNLMILKAASQTTTHRRDLTIQMQVKRT